MFLYEEVSDPGWRAQDRSMVPFGDDDVIVESVKYEAKDSNQYR